MATSEPHTSSHPSYPSSYGTPLPLGTRLPILRVLGQGPHRRVLPDLYEDARIVLPHEDLDVYTAGGFHPVNLGDTFQGERYTIRHKLGYGGFSTAWLAYDKDTLYADPCPNYSFLPLVRLDFANIAYITPGAGWPLR